MIRRPFFAVPLFVLVLLIACTTGCIQPGQTGEDFPPTGSTSDAENPVIKVYGTTQEDGWLVRSWAESYHENEKLTELREFMNRTWYPTGPVLGWDVDTVVTGDSFVEQIVLYVNAAQLPTEAEMDRIYAEWEMAAGQDGSVTILNRSRSITGLPLVFEKVTFPIRDSSVPLQILLVQPREGDVFYGDVVPHSIPVEVYILSENGLAFAEVQSVFYGGNGSTRIVSTPLENHGTRIRVPSISGETNISVVAVDMRGNILEKLVNITVRTGIPFGPHG